MTRDLKSDRWTCPNDRNLLLRSRLNAGWSVNTSKRTHKKDPQLTDTELLEIQKVLQRSEALERNERERVLRMVDRLENLKRNASQSNCTPSHNRCGICGDYFCLIRAMPNQCGACQRVLCNKCSIDTPLNYEDYMNTPNPYGGSSSGGNTFHSSSYNVNQSSLSVGGANSRRSSSVSFNGMIGGRDSALSVGGAGGASGAAGSASNGRMCVYLCRLCSEQREFLKKSGVWFMRKYPSYLLNADNTNNNNTNDNTTGTITNGSNKFNSTSNISQMEDRIPSSASKSSFMSPHSGGPNGPNNANGSANGASNGGNGLRRNLSTSSSNSSSFRFWKNLNLNYFQHDTGGGDNVSDISNEHDQMNDINNKLSGGMGADNAFEDASPTSQQHHHAIHSSSSSSDQNHNHNQQQSNAMSQQQKRPSQNDQLFTLSSNNSNTSSSSTNGGATTNSSNLVSSPSSLSSVSSHQQQQQQQQQQQHLQQQQALNRSTYSFRSTTGNSGHQQQQQQQHKNKSSKHKPDSISIHDKLKSHHNYSDDDDDESSSSDVAASPNMSNYNYYSNIITNLNPTSASLNLIANGVNGNGSGSGMDSDSPVTTRSIESPADEKNADAISHNSLTSQTLTSMTSSSVNAPNHYNSSSTSTSTIKPTKSFTPASSTTINGFLDHKNIMDSSPSSHSISSNKVTKTNSVNNDEIVRNYNQSNSTRTASMTDLDPSELIVGSAKIADANASAMAALNRNLARKGKGLEWCSTQLSMDENSDKQLDLMSKISSNRIYSQNSSEQQQQQGGNNRASRSHVKISSQTVNNLAKKILSQNTSSTGSSSPSATAGSVTASSLATSLTKLNFK